MQYHAVLIRAIKKNVLALIVKLQSMPSIHVDGSNAPIPFGMLQMASCYASAPLHLIFRSSGDWFEVN